MVSHVVLYRTTGPEFLRSGGRKGGILGPETVTSKSEVCNYGSIRWVGLAEAACRGLFASSFGLAL